MRLALPLALALSVLLAGPASAANVRVTASGVSYDAIGGEVNNVTVTLTGTSDSLPSRGSMGFFVRDATALVRARAGCTQVDAHSAFCVGLDRMEILLHDGDDSYALVGGNTSRGGQIIVDGGPGDDLLEGGVEGVPAGSRLPALGPVQLLFGGFGDDVLAGAGDARLTGGPGADDFSALQGSTAIVLYTERVASVSADPDGVADDGEPGEGDNIVPGIRAIHGGAGADDITAEVAFGFGGDDVLRAESATGATLDGGENDDLLIGTESADVLRGGYGDDILRGLGGADELTDGLGRDILDGGAGVDRLRSAEDSTGPVAAPDSVTCGDDADVVTASDPDDTVADDCELSLPGVG